MTRQLRVSFAAAAVLALRAAPARAAEENLEIIPEPVPLLILLGLFVVLVPLLDKMLFAPLLGVIEEREARIEGARERAAALAQQAHALVAKHDEAVRSVREAANAERVHVLEEARRSHQQAIAEARREAERQMAATRADVEAAIEAARRELRAEAEPLAREVAERLLGRSLS